MHTPTLHTTTSLARSSHGDGPWEQRAACRGQDVSLFFSSDDADQQTAMRTCVECPVRMDCLTNALRDEELHGVWGGMLEADRRALIRQRKETAARRRVTTLTPAAQTKVAPRLAPAHAVIAA